MAARLKKVVVDACLFYPQQALPNAGYRLFCFVAGRYIFVLQHFARIGIGQVFTVYFAVLVYRQTFHRHP